MLSETTIGINGHQFSVELADTSQEHYIGLSDYPFMDDEEGMLFIFSKDMDHPMVMRDMEFDLDILHIDPDWKILSIATASKNDTNAYYVGIGPSLYVIELAAGACEKYNVQEGMIVGVSEELEAHIASLNEVPMAREGIKVGKAKDGTKVYDVEIDDIPHKEDHYQVLDKEGAIAANIQEGARIFSRDDTQTMISKVRNASGCSDIDALKKLGKFMVDVIVKQDTQRPEYTT